MAMEQDKEFVREITPREVDYSQWYVDVVLKAGLADYAPVKGCIVIRPYGYALWEAVQRELDARFKETGHVNAYFPMLIPESFFRKEAEHVEGFSPQVAWVTHGGDEQLGERLAVRPTSETIICTMYSKWIQSWRDLPVLINQWCSVVRWEKATRPFLRTTEFLWQEGHTAHRTEEEAEREARRILEIYRSFMEEVLAIPVIVGQKSESEKFAGALRTYCVEALMSDGRALQAGTSHNLGQHFSKVFDITFLDTDGQLKYVWQTSWGVSHRIIGALVMVHGDDRGLVLPPRIAPHQVVIVPIAPVKRREEVLEHARVLCRMLSEHCRVKLDDREEYTPGWKFNEWEMRGVPLRVEIGPRDIDAGQVVLARRDRLERITVSRDQLVESVLDVLESIQRSMYQKALRFLEDNTHRVDDFNEFCRILAERRGFLRTGWCGDGECERAVKEATGATIRCIPFVRHQDPGPCIYCGAPGRYEVYFARAY